MYSVKVRYKDASKVVMKENFSCLVTSSQC